MLYCGFENTTRDLMKCEEILRTEDLMDLNESEKKYAKKLITLCREISKNLTTYLNELNE